MSGTSVGGADRAGRSWLVGRSRSERRSLSRFSCFLRTGQEHELTLSSGSIHAIRAGAPDTRSHFEPDPPESGSSVDRRLYPNLAVLVILDVLGLESGILESSIGIPTTDEDLPVVGNGDAVFGDVVDDVVVLG